MKQVLLALIAGTVITGLAAVYAASSVPAQAAGLETGVADGAH